MSQSTGVNSAPEIASKPGPRGAKKQPVGWRSDLAAWWQGFSQPSALAFSVFGLSLVATVALCVWFFSEATIGGWYGRYLPRSALDDDGFATREALKAGYEEATLPRLMVLGSSTIAQAVGSGQELEQKILDLTGQKWRVVVLTTAGQSPTEQFALIECALERQRADSPPVVVAVGFGPQRMRWTAEKTVGIATSRRLGLRSDWEDAEVRVLGGTPMPRRGFYPLDNWDFFLVNGARSLLRVALQQPASRKVDYFTRGREGPETQAVRDTRGARIRDSFPQRHGYYSQISRLAANVASRPNTSLVFIEETISPDLVTDQGLAGIYDQMRQEMAEMAQQQGFRFWPVTTEANLSSAHYHDDLHIQTGEAQDILRTMIARHMSVAMTLKGIAHGE